MLFFGDPRKLVRARVEARKRGEDLLDYQTTLDAAAHDERILRAMEADSPDKLAALMLAQQAGFGVVLDVTEWLDDESAEGVFVTSKLAITPEATAKIAALVFANARLPQFRSIAHRSTRHPGWQVSRFDGDTPIGHGDAEDLVEVFDPMVGVGHGDLLAQVQLTDGRTLTRAGFEPMRVNPTDAKSIGKAAKLNQLLVALDRALTGKEPSPTSSARTLTEEDMVFDSSRGVLYLSDGGYSRVFLGMDDGRLGIDPGLSRPKPLERWSSTAALRRQIEDHLREWVRSQGADPVEDMGWEPNPRPRHRSVLRRKIRW